MQTQSLQKKTSVRKRTTASSRESTATHIAHALRAGGIRAKLRIGSPTDPLESEADRVADQVMRMPEPDVRLKPS